MSKTGREQPVFYGQGREPDMEPAFITCECGRIFPRAEGMQVGDELYCPECGPRKMVQKRKRDFYLEWFARYLDMGPAAATAAAVTPQMSRAQLWEIFDEAVFERAGPVLRISGLGESLELCRRRYAEAFERSMEHFGLGRVIVEMRE